MAETLAELVRTRLNELGLGVREAARKAEPVINAADISDLQLGKRVNITPAKMQALALALQVPLVRVQAAVRTSIEAEPLRLPGRLNHLHPELRIALVKVGDYFLRMQDEGHDITPPEQAAGTIESTEPVPSRRKRGSP